MEGMSINQPPVPRIANRYGAPKPGLSGSTKKRVALTVLAVAVIGIAIFSLLTGIRPITSKDVGFNIVGPASARVDFDVTKAPEATAQCAVQVLSENYAVVGWKVVTIGPNPTSAGADGGRTTAHQVELRTESNGVSGGVNSCWIVEESSASRRP